MSNRLTLKQRIAAVEVMKGKSGTEAIEKAGYSPNNEAAKVGKQIAESSINPLGKHMQYMERASGLAITMLDKDEPDELPSWSDRLKAADLILKLNGIFDKKGDTFNTLVIGDLQAMDEGTLMSTLQQLRAKNATAQQSGEMPIGAEGDEPSAVQAIEIEPTT